MASRLQSLMKSRRSTSAILVFLGFILTDVTVYPAAVPLFNRVLVRSVESLRQSRYSPLNICIVCEPDDPASVHCAQQLATAPNVEYLVNTRPPGSKAGAINYAVSVAETPYIAVFDADEEVHPLFISRAVAELAKTDIVQGRTIPRPTGFIESLGYYESLLLSYIARRILYIVTGFRMASSRAIVLDRSTFEASGGYDAAMLTEDFDFAYRCYKRHLTVTEVLAYPSTIEAAHTWHDWWGQRKRWMTGYVQVLGKLVREIRPLTRYRNVLSVLICLGTLSGAFLMLSLLAKFAVLALLGAELWFALPVSVVMLTAASVHAVDRWSGAIPNTNVYWIAVPVIFPLYSLAAIRSAFEYLLTRNYTWYHVAKATTEASKTE
jgi:cellulose synthase/poly-beta-1,6-N-acetylglucosamine synthase-like glycosyltransferase